MLDGPQKVKNMRAEQERDEKERRDRQAIRNFNDAIIRSQEKQYEKALEEVNLYKQLQELRDYINLIHSQMSDFSEKEKKNADLWIKIFREYANEADPIKKRLNKIKIIANEPEDKYNNYWCRKAKPYTLNKYDVVEDKYEY